ncbi:MAG TPA: hypothetical protein VG796_01040 [Verrucomicrobiales bacterium]|nr:hypothetical protein [Verrucomicrobiales bacterium]
MKQTTHPRLSATLAALFCCAVLLSSCRHHAPVVRHFLRMPAEYAGGLSTIQRARWLKASRRSLPSSKVMTASGHLSLAGTSTKRGRILLGMEMLHVPSPDGNGGLAVVILPGDDVSAPPRLHLLEHQRFVYKESPVRPAPHAVWRIDPADKTVTGYDRRGAGLAPVTVVRWTGTSWSTR